MSSRSCFSSVFLLLQFFLCMWGAALFFNRPSVLFWVFALQLLVKKSITFDLTTVYQSLYTGFSWFCSFHSASVPGDFPSSHRISPFRHSFQHRSIPSPTYTTICSAIPHLKGIPSFSQFVVCLSVCLSIKRAQLEIFFLGISLGYKPSNGMYGGQLFSTLCAWFQNAIQNGWISSGVHQQCIHVLIWPDPLQHSAILSVCLFSYSARCEVVSQSCFDFFIWEVPICVPCPCIHFGMAWYFGTIDLASRMFLQFDFCQRFGLSIFLSPVCCLPSDLSCILLICSKTF